MLFRLSGKKKARELPARSAEGHRQTTQSGFQFGLESVSPGSNFDSSFDSILLNSRDLSVSHTPRLTDPGMR